MRKTLLLSFLSISLCTATGCMTAAKRVLKEGKGASSDTQVVGGAGSFSRFGGVEISQPTSDLGSLVSSGFKSALVSELRKELISDKDAPFRANGSPRVTIDPQVQWYHKGGSVFPEKFAVVLFLFKADGADQGKVLIVTKSEATHTSDEGLAESMAKELASYFEKHGKKSK